MNERKKDLLYFLCVSIFISEALTGGSLKVLSLGNNCYVDDISIASFKVNA